LSEQSEHRYSYMNIYVQTVQTKQNIRKKHKKRRNSKKNN